MGKLTATIILSTAFVSTFNAASLWAQACATKPVETASGPAQGCAAPGASCSPAINEGGPGRCVPSAVKTGANALRCVCAASAVRTSADPAIDIGDLVAELSAAKRGDVFNFAFTAADLTQQQTNVFFAKLFDARPKVLSMQLRVEVIALGKRARNEKSDDTSSPSLTSSTLELSITGDRVIDSFDISGVGPTGPNMETFIAGTVLFNLKKLVFEGLVTATMTNNISTEKDPIVLVEGWSGSLDPKMNTVTFETSAPDNAFIIPAAGLSGMSATIMHELPLPKPDAKEFNTVEKAKLAWFAKVHQDALRP